MTKRTRINIRANLHKPLIAVARPDGIRQNRKDKMGGNQVDYNRYFEYIFGKVQIP